MKRTSNLKRKLALLLVWTMVLQSLPAGASEGDIILYEAEEDAAQTSSDVLSELPADSTGPGENELTESAGNPEAENDSEEVFADEIIIEDQSELMIGADGSEGDIQWRAEPEESEPLTDTDFSMEEAPIEISSAQQLMDVSIDLSGNYVLTEDIDLKDVIWKPLGDEEHPFTGTFDGAGHSIFHWKQGWTDEMYVGLFGVTEGAVISNLGVQGEIVIPDETAETEIYAGGLAGKISDTIVNRCAFAVEIVSDNSGTVCGTIAGRAEDNSLVTECSCVENGLEIIGNRAHVVEKEQMMSSLRQLISETGFSFPTDAVSEEEAETDASAEEEEAETDKSAAEGETGTEAPVTEEETKAEDPVEGEEETETDELVVEDGETPTETEIYETETEELTEESPEGELGIPSVAEAAPESDFKYYKTKLDGEECVYITGYTGSDKEIVIPDEIEGYPVLEIGGMGSIEKITLPACLRVILDTEKFTSLKEFAMSGESAYFEVIDGVLFSLDPDSGERQIRCYPAAKEGESYEIPEGTIGASANGVFNGCENLVSVTIPSSMAAISYYMFNSCQNLQEVTINAGKELGIGSLFYNCPNLRILTSYRNLKNVDTYDFDNLEQIILGPEVSSYSGYYFNQVGEFVVDASNESLMADESGVLYTKDGQELIAFPTKSQISEYEVSPDTRTIGERAFMNAENLQTIQLPDQLVSIGISAFSHTLNLQSLALPDTLTSIGERAFLCSGITELTFDFQQECKLGDFCMGDEGSDGGKLKKVSFIAGVSKVKRGIWGVVGGLETIFISETVTEVELPANAGTQALQKIEVSEANPTYKSESGILYTKDGSVLVAIPAAYPETEYQMPDTVREVAANAASYNKNIRIFLGGRGLQSIGEYAFNSCSDLEYIFLPGLLKTIGGGAFSRGAYSMVEIPANVESIAAGAFSECMIYGYSGTEAERFALEEGLPFTAIDEEGNPEMPGTENPDSQWDGESVEEVIPTGNIYPVSNAAELAWISQKAAEGETFAGKTIVLTANIDMQGYSWVPIGWEKGFSGSFYGNGRIIANLALSTGDYYYAGLIGKINVPYGSHCFIRDLELSGVKFESARVSGGAAGQIYLDKGGTITIENVKVSGTMRGGTQGGIVGVIYNTSAGTDVTIKNCTVNDIEFTSGEMGGIVGYINYGSNDHPNSALISNCRVDATIKSTGRYDKAGGIIRNIAQNGSKGTVKVSGCVTEGTYNPGRSTTGGGVVGEASGNGSSANVEIYGCVNKATVNGGYYTGGIAGSIGAGVQIVECCNEGYIMTGETGGVYGGLCGSAGNGAQIRDSMNIGSLGSSNFADAGGITGRFSGSSRISNCYCIGGLPQSWHGTSGVSAPGAFAARRNSSGVVSSSYFSLDAVPVMYPFGEDFVENKEERDVVTTEDGAILHSGGIFSAEFKDPKNLVNWDFENVWTYSETFSSAYPVPFSIKDLVTRVADEAKSEKNSEGTHFYVTVLDVQGEALPDAQVTVGTEQLTTNDHGIVQFAREKLPADLSVTKEGYIAYIREEFDLSDETSDYKVYLKKEEDVSQYDLSSVLLTYVDQKYELLCETKQINIYKKDTGITISCKLAYPEAAKDVASYALLQGTDVVAESKDGMFQLKAGDFQEKFSAGNSIYVVLYGSDKEKLSQTMINLNIVYAEEKQVDDFLKIGEVFGFKLQRSDFGLFDGSEFSFGKDKLPLYVVIEDDKWKIGVNIDPVKLEAKDGNFLFNMQRVEKNLSSGLSSYKDYMLKPSITLGDNPKITLSLLGYAEGSLPFDDEIELTLSGVREAEGDYKGQVKVFVVGGKLSGKVQQNGSVKIDTQKWKIYQPLSGVTRNKITFELNADMELYLGFGLAQSVNAGIYGDMAFNLNYLIYPEAQSGPEKIWLEGETGIRYNLLGSDKHIPLVEGEKILYNRDTETSMTSAAVLAAAEEEMPEPEYHAVPRDSYSKRSAWKTESPGTGGDVLIQSNAYPDLAPNMVTCGEDVLMLFLNDGDGQRSEEDKSMLMYSVYDRTKGNWGSPLAVADDGTADMNMKAVSDGENLYVLWSNAKGKLTDGSSLAEVGRQMELFVAKYNPQEKQFSDVWQITDNEVCENSAEISLKGGIPYITWTVNSEEDIWRTKGVNTVYRAELSGDTWNTSQLMTTESGILADLSGYIGDEFCYVYMSGQNSDNLIVCRDGGSTSEVICKGGAANAKFVKMSGKNALLWSDMDGTVYVLEEPGASSIVLFENFSGIFQELLSDESGNMVLLYTRNQNTGSNVYARYYSAASQTWSQECALTAQESYIERVTGTYADGKLVLVYNQKTTTQTENGMKTENNLRTCTVKAQTADLKIKQADFDPYQVKPGEELLLTLLLVNQGDVQAESVRINISNGEQAVSEQTIEESMLPGEEKEIQISLMLPEDFARTTFTLTAEDPLHANTDLKGNAYTVSVGEAILKTVNKLYRVADNYTVDTVLRNEGYNKTSGKLIVYNAESEGEVYAEYCFTEMEHGDVLYYSTELSGFMPEYGNQRVGVRVESDDENTITAGTTETLMAYQEDRVEVTGVQLDETEITFTAIGETHQLAAKVLPENATDPSLTYRSSNQYVATVSPEGLIEAVSNGTARIYVMSQSSGKQAVCKVNVSLKVPVSSVTLKQKEMTLLVGERKELEAEITPYYSDSVLEWTSSDDTVVKVSQDGVITCESPGTATITAAADGASDSCTITVTEDENTIYVSDVTGLTTGGSYENNMDRSWIYRIDNQEKEGMLLTFSEDTVVEEDFDWINLYDGNGKQIGSYTGDSLAGNTVYVPGDTVRIQVVSDESYTETGFTVVSVTPTDPVSAQNLTLSPQIVELKVGESCQLSVEVNPQEAVLFHDISWTTDNSAVASVDGDGRVVANSNGEAYITVHCGEASTQCRIVVSGCDHEGEWETRKEADCTTEGRQVQVCRKCGIEMGSRTIPLKEHSWKAGQIISEATVFSAAVQSVTCSVCGKTEQQPYGSKCAATMSLPAKTIPMCVKQKTTKVSVTGMANGDSLKSVQSSSFRIVAVSNVKPDGTFKLSAKKKGKAKLTIVLASGHKETVVIKVQKKKVKTKKVKGIPKTLKLTKGAKYKLSPRINPVTSQDKIKYTISDKKIASVSSKGIISAKKKGKTTITVLSGKVKAKCKVVIR